MGIGLFLSFTEPNNWQRENTNFIYIVKANSCIEWWDFSIVDSIGTA